MIQVLTFDGKEEKLKGSHVVLNKLHDAQSLDEFKINVIDLSSEQFWKCSDKNGYYVKDIKDWESMEVMIRESANTKIIILLPQNIEVAYYKHGEKFLLKEELKNIIENLKCYSLERLFYGFNILNIIYENTKTEIGDKQIPASFYFREFENILTKSQKSQKPTTIDCDGVVISTLQLDTYDKIISFLKEIGLIKQNKNVPEWMEQIKMFDDEKQLQTISENNKIIAEANREIRHAVSILDKNNRYKSILYTSGDELVSVVFEILQEMLGCNLSEFVDNKKEDFRFNIGNKIYIGEIKGVTPNVKKANISQIDVHVQEYLDEHNENGENIVALLIINHQRTKPLHERQEVMEEQIKLAKRNGSLIVETITLLNLFSEYLNGKKTREECINLLENNIGLLKL